MAPPRFIVNFLGAGARPFALGGDEGGTDALRSTAAARVTETESREILRDDARDFFLRRHPDRYGATLLGNFRGHSSEEIESYLPRLLNQARGGDRRSFFDALRFSYGVLASEGPERSAFHARRIAGIVQEYLNHLEANVGLNPEQRLHFLFSASRIVHSALSYLESSAGDSNPAVEILRSVLIGMDRQMEEYYGQLSTSGMEMEALRGILLQIRLREALMSGASGDVHRYSQELESYYRDHPPRLEDESWPTTTSRLLATDETFSVAMEQLSGSSWAEENAVLLNGMGLELLVSTAAALDLSDEAELEDVRERYRQLSAVMTVLILRYPGKTLEELLDFVNDPMQGSDVVEALSEAEETNAQLTEMLRQAQGSLGEVQLVEAAREAVQHLRLLREGPGRNLFAPLFEQLSAHHSLHRIAELLNRNTALRDHLDLPNGRDAAARELLRRGEAAHAAILEYAERQPNTDLQSLLRELIARDGAQDANQFTDTLLARIEPLMNGGEDHEVAALHGIFSLIGQDRELSPGLRLAERTRMRAQLLVRRMTGLGYRAERIFDHLTSTPSLASVLSGVVIAEFLPLFILSRASAGGRIASRLVRNGVLTGPGALFTGVGTGLLMGGMGSILHNRARAELGFETHYARDFLIHSGINIATFGLTLPFTRLLTRGLAPRDFTGTGLGTPAPGRMLFIRGTSALVGGGIGWGAAMAARWVQTDELSTSWDEAAENFGSLLMFEGFSAFLRSAISGMVPVRPGLDVGLYRIVGDERLGLLRNLSERVIEANPNLEARHAWILRQLFYAEYRNPAETDAFRARLERSDFPTLVRSGPLGLPYYSLRLIPRENFPASIPDASAPSPPPVGNPPPIPRRGPFLLGPGAATVEPSLVEGPESDHFVLRYHPEEGETVTHSSLSLAHLGEESSVLGRRDFLFLNRSLRQHVSREHFRIQREGEGWWIEDLSRNGTWVEEWTRVNLGETHREVLQWTPLAGAGRIFVRPGQRIALGRIHLPRSTRRSETGDPAYDQYYYETHAPEGREAESRIFSNFADLEGALVLQLEIPGRPAHRGGRPPSETSATVNPESAVSPTRVALEAGRNQRLGRARIIRDREHSLYRLIGDGSIRVDLLREYGAEGENGEIQTFSATDNPILGEVGESVWLRMTHPDGSSAEHHLFLDNAAGAGTRLPVIRMSLEGRERTLRFRATSPEINIGRLTDQRFFESHFISRNHFTLRIGADMGHPRYYLTVQSQHGLLIEGLHFRRGETARPMSAGSYELGFLRPGNRTDSIVSSMVLELPPIDVNFPEWRIPDLLPNHDMAQPNEFRFRIPGIPETPPAIPVTNRPPPVPAPGIAQLAWQFFRNLFRGN